MRSVRPPAGVPWSRRSACVVNGRLRQEGESRGGAGAYQKGEKTFRPGIKGLGGGQVKLAADSPRWPSRARSFPRPPRKLAAWYHAPSSAAGGPGPRNHVGGGNGITPLFLLCLVPLLSKLAFEDSQLGQHPGARSGRDSASELPERLKTGLQPPASLVTRTTRPVRPIWTASARGRKCRSSRGSQR